VKTIKIRQFREKAQNQRQFGRGMSANPTLSLPKFTAIVAKTMHGIKEKKANRQQYQNHILAFLPPDTWNGASRVNENETDTPPLASVMP